MALDIFLVIPKINSNPPIPGEIPSTDPYFKGLIGAVVVPLQDFEFGAQVPVNLSGTGSGAGRLTFRTLVIHRAVDIGSVSLLELAAQSKPFGSVQLYVRQPGNPQGKPFLAYEFQTTLLTDLNWTISTTDNAPLEQATFVYGALFIGYRTSNADGSLNPAAKNGWSQLTNAPTTADNDLLPT